MNEGLPQPPLLPQGYKIHPEISLRHKIAAQNLSGLLSGPLASLKDETLIEQSIKLADKLIIALREDRSKPNPDWVPADSSHGGECGHFVKSPK
jgi:hypothetical protein